MGSEDKKSIRCKFDIAWSGQCKNVATDNGYCDEHKNLMCNSCGKKATHSCYETMGPLVCGSPLCEDCEHTIQSNGCNSGGKLPKGYKAHCQKGKQIYRSWIAQEYIKEHGEAAYQELVRSFEVKEETNANKRNHERA